MENEETVQTEEVEEVKEKKGFKDNKKQNKEIAKLKEENANLNEKILRISAEMQNIKRRNEEEISKIYRYEGEGFIKKILPTLDNFERALSMNNDNLPEDAKKFLQGFNLIYNEFTKTINSLGVKEIECLDKEFDPNSMDAVLTEEVEGVPKNQVICVMQKGYIYNDKVIRPAMVKVSE